MRKVLRTICVILVLIYGLYATVSAECPCDCSYTVAGDFVAASTVGDNLTCKSGNETKFELPGTDTTSGSQSGTGEATCPSNYVITTAH